MKPSGSKGGGRRRSASGKNTPRAGAAPKKPEWAQGLRQLYDSVVDEPLPDNFKDLLAKLDKKT